MNGIYLEATIHTHQTLYEGMCQAYTEVHSTSKKLLYQLDHLVQLCKQPSNEERKHVRLIYFFFVMVLFVFSSTDCGISSPWEQSYLNFDIEGKIQSNKWTFDMLQKPKNQGENSTYVVIVELCWLKMYFWVFSKLRYFQLYIVHTYLLKSHGQNLSFKNHQIGNFITGTTFITLFHVSSLFDAFFAMSATQPQYVWQDLNKRSKSRSETITAWKAIR